MPYVQIPKDLTKVKTKLAFNLTKRQLICFGSAVVIGIPVYLLTRGAIGNTMASMLMMCLMLPLFALGMYEKDGQPAEKIVINYIRARWFYPQRRLYKTRNLYEYLENEGEAMNINEKTKATTAKKSSKK